MFAWILFGDSTRVLAVHPKIATSLAVASASNAARMGSSNDGKLAYNGAMNARLAHVRRLVGGISPRQYRHVDVALAKDVGVFTPVSGQCDYATSPGHTHPSYSFVLSFDGATRMLLDVTAGRADVPNAVRRKELGVDDWPGLLALTPIVEQVPGIPGRTALVAAAKAAGALAGAIRLFGRG